MTSKITRYLLQGNSSKIHFPHSLVGKLFHLRLYKVKKRFKYEVVFSYFVTEQGSSICPYGTYATFFGKLIFLTLMIRIHT